MIDLLNGIKDKLIAAGVGRDAPIREGKPDWTIFVGKQATTPTATVTVKVAPGPDANPKYLLDYPAIQIMIRGNKGKYEEAYAKAQLVKDCLLGIPSQDVNNIRWVLVNIIGDINDLGEDANNSPLFSLNFQFIIEPPTNPNSNRIPL